MEKILIGKIYKNETLLQLHEKKDDNQCNQLMSMAFDNKDYENFETLLKQFIGNNNIDKGCITIPGHVVENRPTNPESVPWNDVDGNHLSRKLGVRVLSLVSEVNAGGFSPLILDKTKLIDLNNKDTDFKGKILLIQITNEVHVSLLVTGHVDNNREQQRNLQSCAANTSLCPKNDFDYKFQKFLRNKLDLSMEQVVTFEHMISTKGLAMIYEYVCKIKESSDRTEFDFESVIEDLDRGIGTALMATEYYFEILGSFLFNTSTFFLPEGGIIFMGQPFIKLLNTLRTNMGIYQKILIDNFALTGYLGNKFNNLRISAYNGNEDPHINGALEMTKNI